MSDKFDDLVNGLLKKTLFEAPMAPVEEPEVEPDIETPEVEPVEKPSKPVVPKRHPLQPTRPDVKPRPQAKGPISPDVQAYINARK